MYGLQVKDAVVELCEHHTLMQAIRRVQSIPLYSLSYERYYPLSINVDGQTYNYTVLLAVASSIQGMYRIVLQRDVDFAHEPDSFLLIRFDARLQSMQAVQSVVWQKEPTYGAIEPVGLAALSMLEATDTAVRPM